MNTEHNAPHVFTTEGSRLVAVIIWYATSASILFLLAAGSVAVDGSPTQTTPERDTFLHLFPMTAVVLLVLSGLVFVAMRLSGRKVTQSSTTHDSQRVVTRPIIAMLVCCALNECVAVLGFVFALVTKDFSASLPYCGAALAANFVVYPS